MPTCSGAMAMGLFPFPARGRHVLCWCGLMVWSCDLVV